jgi:hypothetical protein
MLEIIDELKSDDCLVFLKMRKNITIDVSFAKVFKDKDGVGLRGRSQSVEDVVVKHDVLKVFETTDFLILPESVNDSLYFGKHIIEQDLFAEGIDDFVVVDGLRAGEGGVLIESEAFLEGEPHAVLEVASLIKHGLSFLNDARHTILELRRSWSVCLSIELSINFYSI